jgi:hypothetical protein
MFLHHQSLLTSCKLSEGFLHPVMLLLVRRARSHGQQLPGYAPQAFHASEACSKPAAHGQQPLPLLLVVTEASPYVFREHHMQPTSPDTKRALSASVALPASSPAGTSSGQLKASRHEHHLHQQGVRYHIQHAGDFSASCRSNCQIPCCCWTVPESLVCHKSRKADSREESESSKLECQMLHSLSTYMHLLQQLKHLMVRLPCEEDVPIHDSALQLWWKQLLGTSSASCIQLESLEVDSLQGATALLETAAITHPTACVCCWQSWAPLLPTIRSRWLRR